MYQSIFHFRSPETRGTRILWLESISYYPSVYHRLLPIFSWAFMFMQLVRSLFLHHKLVLYTLFHCGWVLIWNSQAGKSAPKGCYLSSSRDARRCESPKYQAVIQVVQDIETTRRWMGGHGYWRFWKVVCWLSAKRNVGSLIHFTSQI